MDNPSTSDASLRLSLGRMQRFIPRSFAINRMGNTPFTARIAPFSPISPITSVSLSASSGTIPSAVRIATVIGRSNPFPLFFIFAGDRLMVIRLAGSWCPQLRSAVRTRSFASRTSDARKPTISNTGSPSLTSAST